jgi:threonyl-tRNA synthetase
MPVITLPDGSQRHFDHAVSPMDVALDIGPGLAKATIAGRVNGELVDACDPIETMPPSLSSPRKMKKVWRSFVTPARTC